LVETYQVKLGIYSGPLDLLLYLVRQREVDIEDIDVGDITGQYLAYVDIDVGDITGQYLAYVDLIRELDLDFAADFLVTAATLMLIKVRSALPVEEVSLDDGEEEEEDPRMELIRQLMEYKKYRDAAALLAERADEHEKHIPRRGVMETEPTSVEEMLRDVNLWDLMKAFQKILASTGADAEQIVVLDDRPVSQYMEELRRALAGAPGRRISFTEAFAGKCARYDLIGMFLAILELARLSRIRVVQEDHQSEIEIALTSAGEAPLSEEERRMVEVAGGAEVAGGGEVAGSGADGAASRVIEEGSVVGEGAIGAAGAAVAPGAGPEEESEGEKRHEEESANDGAAADDGG